MGSEQAPFQEHTDFEKRPNKNMAVANEFDVYGDEESADSTYHRPFHSLIAHHPSSCSQIPHNGVVESRRAHACGDGLPRSARSLYYAPASRI